MRLRWFFRSFCRSNAVGHDRYPQHPNTLTVADIDRIRSADPQAFAESNSAADPNADALTRAYANANARPNANADAGTNGDTDAPPNTNADTRTNGDTDARSYANGRAFGGDATRGRCIQRRCRCEPTLGISQYGLGQRLFPLVLRAH